jgi:hypothetical protein
MECTKPQNLFFPNSGLKGRTGLWYYPSPSNLWVNVWFNARAEVIAGKKRLEAHMIRALMDQIIFDFIRDSI